jgi:3-oxoacyl-[acyl-carrier protein] reductase
MPETTLVIGASKGVGEALVSAFSASDANEVYGFARSFGAESGDRMLHLDLGSPTLRQDLEKAIESIESIDVLVNNAGAIAVKPFTDLSREEIQYIYQVNVIGVMECIQACLPKMGAGSHIVNISSMGGFQGSAKFPGLSAYSPSKAALASLTEILAEELKPTGVHVNCLCLGAVQTEMLEKAFPGYQAPHSAEEMAAFIADFALNGGRFFNGKILPVSISTP